MEFHGIPLFLYYISLFGLFKDSVLTLCFDVPSVAALFS